MQSACWKGSRRRSSHYTQRDPMDPMPEASPQASKVLQRTPRGGMRWLIASSLVVLVPVGTSLAGPADVISASADCSSSICAFVVTVRHDDEGWSHYVNAWEVLTPAGAVLATRILHHPHVGEQPFTRELRDVKVPSALTSVRIRARDSVHGIGGREVVVPLGK